MITEFKFIFPTRFFARDILDLLGRIDSIGNYSVCSRRSETITDSYFDAKSPESTSFAAYVRQRSEARRETVRSLVRLIRAQKASGQPTVSILKALFFSSITSLIFLALAKINLEYPTMIAKFLS
jgi:hypothetical protein